MASRDLLDSVTAKWIIRTAQECLKSRAKFCAINTWQHLEHAARIADIAPTVSFFCSTHAVEEAVAGFVCSAKVNGFQKEAKTVNIKDHYQKAMVAAFARLIADRAKDIELHFAYYPEKEDLFARIPRGDRQEYHRLTLSLLSYNPVGGDKSADNATDDFLSQFADITAMKKALRKHADLRNKALYASEEGTPAMKSGDLKDALRSNTITALGLIWASADLARHSSEKPPLVCQLFGAMNRIEGASSCTKNQ